MRSLMRSNPLKIAVLAWFAGWLLFVMPGHKRGIVTLPGPDLVQAASCCQPKPDCCPAESQPACPASDTDAPRPVDPARQCAICFLKAHLTDPPPITLYTPYLGELGELAFHVESSIADDLTAPDRMRGRAPPA